MKALRKKYALLFSRCSTSGLELHQNRCWASRWRLTCGRTAQHNSMQSSNLSTLLQSTCSWRDCWQADSSSQAECCLWKWILSQEENKLQIFEVITRRFTFCTQKHQKPHSAQQDSKAKPISMWKLHRFTKEQFLHSWGRTALLQRDQKWARKGKKGEVYTQHILCIETTLYICICSLEATSHPQWLPNSRTSANHSSYHDTKSAVC